MRQKHLLGLGLAAGCLAGFVLLGIVQADDDESPREQHRRVVVGLSGGATAAVDAATDQDVVRAVTRLSGPGSSSSSPGSVGDGSRAVTRGGGSQSLAPGPATPSICPGQSCETQPDGSVRIIGGGPAPGETWFTDIPQVRRTGTPPVGSDGVDSGAIAGDMVQEIRLPDIVVRTNPVQGVVAIPTWYWVEGYAGDALSDSRTVSTTHDECRNVEVPDPDGGPPISGRECGPVTVSTTVTLRVKPTTYRWSFGDGGMAELGGAEGLGTPFRGVGWPSTVQHTYEYSSFGLNDGFPVRLTVTFTASFQVNGGAWQGLNDISRTYAGTHIVRQVEPLRISLEPGPAPAGGG